MTLSSELTAGSGFTFENFVAARYLAALLTEASAPGLNGTVVSVALQQRAFGEPLDDVIVDSQISGGMRCRLSLQCKTGLTISDAKSNEDFREVIHDSAKTLGKPDFHEGLDRFGAAVGSIATDKFDAVTDLCDIARADADITHFEARFSSAGNASQAIRRVKDDIASLLVEELGAEFSSAVLFRFLRHFVLVRFDALHTGAVDSAEAINSVRPALAPAANSQAAALWSALCQFAREEAARAAQLSRSSLLVRLDPMFALAGAPSLQADLTAVAHLTTAWVQDIDDDVRGVHLVREQLVAALDLELTRERFVQIRGLPGSGKSVLLRRRVEADLKKGPVLFLKSDRLEGKSWASFAKAIGLSAVSLVDLLVEIGRVGSPILYIDGVDRIEKAHQGIVADLVRAILSHPLLIGWRIVISLRDAGSEPLRTWLPDLFDKGRLGTIDVGLLEDDEAEALAEKRPELRPLLFGSTAVREIVRRPFFAKVLSQALVHSDSSTFAPVSEVDLVENWWARGGFDAVGTTATLRQRAIVDLAARRVRDLSQPILLAHLAPTTVNEVDGLVGDGILQIVRPGHSVRFSHDIFFEWALFHLLTDRGAAWPDEIKAAGEPPMVGRVVELLSQADFVADREWDATLVKIEASDLRSQWSRAWLLGPIFTPSFDSHSERYFAIGARDDFRLLRKALVWFQAEKTIPNAAILDGRIGSANLTRHEIVRLADSLGWPSDFSAWRRIVVLLLDHIAGLPAAVLSDVVVVFEVWQNALSDLPNAVSTRILAQCAVWLSEIEKQRHTRWNRGEDLPPSRWQGHDGDLQDLENTLRTLILRSARVRSDLVTTYLSELKADEHRLDKVFKGVVLFSGFLANCHADLLVEISLQHFKEELPEDRIRKEREKRQHAHERRAAARAKPADERTREDEMVLSGPFSILGSSFNSYEWDNLAVDRDIGEYFPASPLREPFHSLFQQSPQHALRLIKEMSNHAVLAWRQLHRVDPQRQARSPIPIAIEFPWGRQEFWGTGREYLWFRGIWAPKPLAGAYQAMERWALAELDAGRPVDEVIRDVVVGHDSVAALGIAASLLLKSKHVSTTTLPLITAQRLWRYDLNRKVQEIGNQQASQIGWRGETDRPHYEAVKALNSAEHRGFWLRDIIPAFLLSEDQSIADKARSAILAFADELPFEYEEYRTDADFAATLREEGQFNAEFAKPENVKAAPVPGGSDETIVYIDNPKAREPATRERLAQSQEAQNVQLLWYWADKSLKESEIAGDVSTDKALAFAKTICNRSLFKSGGKDRFNQTMRQGAVAGVAAVVLKYRVHFRTGDIRWAEKVLRWAALTPEIKDGLWSDRAIIPWHPGISVAKAMGFQIRSAVTQSDAKIQLLRLVAHPLEGVAIEALRQSLALWDLDPRFAWCAIWEALALCQFETTPREAMARTYDPVYIAGKRTVHANEAIALFEEAGRWADLPALPPAWVKIEQVEPTNVEIAEKDEFAWSEDDEVRSAGQWREPSRVFDWNLAFSVLKELPVEAILARAETRRFYLHFARDLLRWAVEKIAPPWKSKGRRERSNNIGQLDDAVGRLYAKMALVLSAAEMQEFFFAPVFELEDELCYELLAPFVTLYVCAAVYDSKVMPPNAVEILHICADRVLKDRAFDPSSYRASELHGHQLPYMMRALLLVYADSAPGAARFANGDWTELQTMMPIVDRVVRAAGWSWSVMSDYLTLVERAHAVYPAEAFADQVLSILSPGREGLKGWRGLYLPARIAGLVQALGFRDNPMPLALAQKLLRILDVLVDMGDRRSAALQISDPFRNVRSI